MPANPRVRGNNAQGTLTDNPLLVGGTTMNSAGLANLPAVASQHAMIVLDPFRLAGAPEIVIVTAHTAAATSATITRGAMGTTARQHLLSTVWVHAATIDDLIQICTAATRPADPYEGQLIYETDTDSFKGYLAAWEHILTIGAWTTFSPTWTQGVTVTKTDNYARYQRVGRRITVQGYLTATAGGTAANAVAVSLPVTAAQGADIAVGSGYLLDASASLNYPFVAILNTTTSMRGIPTSTDQANYLGAAVFTAAVATGDRLFFGFEYEAATA